MADTQDNLPEESDTRAGGGEQQNKIDAEVMQNLSLIHI